MTALVALLALLALALAAAALLGLGRRASPSAATPSAGAAPAPQVQAPEEVPRTRLELGMGDAVDPRLRPGSRPELAFPREQLDPRRFAGTGRLEVHLEVAAGAQAPQVWALVVEPSRVLIGGEHAAARRLVLRAGEREVMLDDLPLGGYAVRAEAPGLQGPAEQVLLARPTETSAIVRLRLEPAGYVTGRVVDAAGAPVEGLELVLAPAPGGVVAHGAGRRTARTDPGGVYVLEQVLDGEYMLTAGHPDAPLAPPRELAFRAPRLTMPELVVPRLGALALRVVDPQGRALEGARVLGWGADGGRVEGRTDARGELLARFLPPGDFTLVASPPEGPAGEGLETLRTRAEVEAGARRDVELRLRR